MSENAENATGNSIKEMVKTFVADKKDYLKSEGELIIRVGDAEKINPPVKLVVDGVITAPGDFWEKRKGLHDPEKTHVLINLLNGSIKLSVDENNVNSSVISGKLSLNPELTALSINSSKTTTVKELMGLLKMNRVFFTDKDENAKIVTNLQNWKAKIETDLEASNNHRGTQRNVKNIDLIHTMDESFVLEIPIFKGMNPSKFKVDICIDVRDAAVVVWLESRELKELEILCRNAAIEIEKKRFEGVCVMYI